MKIAKIEKERVVRTSFNINQDLFDRLKILAKEHDVSMRQILELSIKQILEQNEKQLTLKENE